MSGVLNCSKADAHLWPTEALPQRAGGIRKALAPEARSRPAAVHDWCRGQIDRIFRKCFYYKLWCYSFTVEVSVGLCLVMNLKQHEADAGLLSSRSSTMMKTCPRCFIAAMEVSEILIGRASGLTVLCPIAWPMSTRQEFLLSVGAET